MYQLNSVSTKLIFVILLKISACEEGWKLLPNNAHPSQKKCYKWFEDEQAENEVSREICTRHSAKFPLPENDQEIDNLHIALHKLGFRFEKYGDTG